MSAVAWFAAGVAFGVAIVSVGVLSVARGLSRQIEREAQRHRDRLIVAPIETTPETPRPRRPASRDDKGTP